jgi:hypothetical protein
LITIWEGEIVLASSWRFFHPSHITPIPFFNAMLIMFFCLLSLLFDLQWHKQVWRANNNSHKMSTRMTFWCHEEPRTYIIKFSANQVFVSLTPSAPPLL